MSALRLAVLTVSDRAARGERQDASGPALKDLVAAQGWQVVREQIVGDDLKRLSDTLAAWADAGDIDIILTTGGTGFAPIKSIIEHALHKAHAEVANGVLDKIAQRMAAMPALTLPAAAAVAGVETGAAGV